VALAAMSKLASKQECMQARKQPKLRKTEASHIYQPTCLPRVVAYIK